MDQNGWWSMKVDGDGWRWMVMDVNGWKWTKMDGDGWKWMVLMYIHPPPSIFVPHNIVVHTPQQRTSFIMSKIYLYLWRIVWVPVTDRLFLLNLYNESLFLYTDLGRIFSRIISIQPCWILFCRQGLTKTQIPLDSGLTFNQAIQFSPKDDTPG